MKTNYRTLIVADHNQAVENLNILLKMVTEATDVTFESYYANCCSEALSILQAGSVIDVVFLDLNLVQEPEIKMYSGRDLGMHIRELYPMTIIIVINAPDDPILVRFVSDSIKPEGFFAKNEILGSNIFSIIRKTYKEKPFYSPTVLSCFIKLLDVSFKIDSRDIQLLRELDNGHTLKKIGEIISLSQCGVSKRKKKLKFLFGVPDGNDRDLIRRAQVLGCI